MAVETDRFLILVGNPYNEQDNFENGQFLCKKKKIKNIQTKLWALWCQFYSFYAQARGSRHQGEYILVVVVFVVPFVKIKKNP